MIICLIFDCARRNFLGRGEVGLLHSFDCDFKSDSKSLTHVSSIATIRYRNAWPSTLNLCFSNVAISRHFCFCSAVKQWGTHRAQIFLFCKSFVKIRNTDVGEIPVACDISSHVARRSCARNSATSFTLRSSVDVFGLPGRGSSFMATCPTRKRVAQPVHCLPTKNFTQSTVNFYRGFRHVKFQSWCTIFDLQPSQNQRRLQTPCLTLVNSKQRKLRK